MSLTNLTDCADDQFKCDDNTCISEDKMCDAVHDCSHGEDEEDCQTNTGNVFNNKQTSPGTSNKTLLTKQFNFVYFFNAALLTNCLWFLDYKCMLSIHIIMKKPSSSCFCVCENIQTTKK